MPVPAAFTPLRHRLASALALALCSLPALAAQDDPRHAEVKDLDEVVVRATLPRAAEP